jgi:hypothetical protein
MGLPEEYRNVKVFLYLTTFSKEQIKKINTVGEGELKEDTSKRSPFPLFTTDQTLFENADIKRKISNEILNLVKSASVDCQLYHTSSDSYSCYDFGNVQTNEFSFKPSITDDILEQGEEKKDVGTVIKMKIKGSEYYALKEEKEDSEKGKFKVYSDGRLKTKVGVYDKETKKLLLDAV